MKINKQTNFIFIDLFAGIGGFRLALEDLGGKCAFSSEKDKQARETYFSNFREEPSGDICNVDASSIPEHDILCGGFPCQAFSIAGKLQGFKDQRGTLFVEVVRILRQKRPSAFILENVANLKRHDGGRTFKVILRELRGCGYYVPEPQILDSADFGLAQQRRRLFIVGFRRSASAESFLYPQGGMPKVTFGSIREKDCKPNFDLSNRIVGELIVRRIRQFHKGNGFGYKITTDADLVRTIRCGGSGREENIVFNKNSLIWWNGIGSAPRWMTPREWARAQGFPEDFKLHPSKSAAYKQLGNAVSVPVVQAVAHNLLNSLRSTTS